MNKQLVSEIDILLELNKILRESSITYMLTGSFAMNYYAEPRMTRDIDIVIELDDNNRKQLYDALVGDYYITKSGIREDMFNVIHIESVTKIDLIVRKNDVYSIQAFKRRRSIELESQEIDIISVEDLIISKLMWSRESLSSLQKRDILNLLTTYYDREYLIYWLSKIGIIDFAKEFVGEGYFG